jgi:beta-phosphoglucomutase
MSVQAIVFDFDGVIANSEPLHLLAFQMTLRDDGIDLSAHDYYHRYLGYDDVGMFQVLGRDRGLPMDETRVAELVERKGTRMQSLLHSGSVLFPGAKEFVLRAFRSPSPLARCGTRLTTSSSRPASPACSRPSSPPATRQRASHHRRPTGWRSSG